MYAPCSSQDPKNKLEVKEHKDSGVYVKGLNAFVVKGVPELRNVLDVSAGVGKEGASDDSAGGREGGSVHGEGQGGLLILYAGCRGECSMQVREGRGRKCMRRGLAHWTTASGLLLRFMLIGSA